MSDLNNHGHRQGSIQGHCSARVGSSQAPIPTLSQTSRDGSSEPRESRSLTGFPWVGWWIWPRDFVKCCSLPFFHHGLGHLDAVCQELWSGGCGAGATQTKRWSQEWMGSVITQASWTSTSCGVRVADSGVFPGEEWEMTWGASPEGDRTQKSVKERSLTSLVPGCQCDRSGLGKWQKGGNREFNDTNDHRSMYFCLRVL